MKIGMKRKLFLSGALLAACIVAGIYYLFLSRTEAVVKPIIPNTASYPYYNLEELSDKAATVVHGVVQRIGKVEIEKIPLSTKFEINVDNGKFMEIAITPVFIKVLESLKPKDSQLKKEVEFREEGGELNSQIIQPNGGFLKVGDEVIIFLNDSGHSWGSMGVLKVSEGKVTAITANETQQFNLEDLKTTIKKSIQK